MRALNRLQPALETARESVDIPRACMEQAFDSIYKEKQSAGLDKPDTLTKAKSSPDVDIDISNLLEEAEAGFKATKVNKPSHETSRSSSKEGASTCGTKANTSQKPPLGDSSNAALTEQLEKEKSIKGSEHAVVGSERRDNAGASEQSIEGLEEKDSGKSELDVPGEVRKVANEEHASVTFRSNASEASLDNLTSVTDYEEEDNLLQELEEFQISSTDDSDTEMDCTEKELPAEFPVTNEGSTSADRSKLVEHPDVVEMSRRSNESYRDGNAIVESVLNKCTDSESSDENEEPTPEPQEKVEEASETFEQVAMKLEQTFKPRIVRCFPSNRPNKEKISSNKPQVASTLICATKATKRASLPRQLRRERRKVKILKELLAESKQEASLLRLQLAALVWEIKRIQSKN